MALANVELARSIYAAWGRGDYSSADWADPEIEFVIADGPSRGEWSGVAEMWKAWRAALSASMGFRAVLTECRALDDTRVLALDRREGRGKASGIDLGQMGSTGASVFHIRNGKVTRLVVYFERENAMAELGLDPEARLPES